MNTIKKLIIPIALLLTSQMSLAALQAMDDEELSNMHGQALYELQEFDYGQVAQPGEDLRMVRLTIGARIELNANVEELSLGRYWRPEGTNCTGGSGGDKVCYNNTVPVGYDDNINWACTAKPCGSVGLNADNYHSSSMTHNVDKSFFDYPGGFQPDSGIDVKLRHVTMGQIRDGVLYPFVQENPYLEFAFDRANNLVGFRAGSEETHGYQGNIIDVISGYIRPTITAEAKLIGIGAGTLSLEASLGGVRTIGWLDVKDLDLKSVSGAASLLVSKPADVVSRSPEAQLFPVQSNYLDHTKAFFFSVGTRSIQWSDVLGFKPEVTMPGFWINMGGDGSLLATTQKGDHPVNYFPGHPMYDTFKNNTNYDGNGGVASLPKWTETYR